MDILRKSYKPMGFAVKGSPQVIKCNLKRFSGLTVLQCINKLEVEFIINNHLG
jgi:hypothetical protein